MKNSWIRRVIALGVLAIAGIVAVQAYWVISTWNINEREFHQKVSLALYRVATHMAELNGSTLPARQIVQQRTTNYYVVNMEDVIDPGVLEYYLQRELESLALNVDFEYAVFDCTTNEMVYGKYFSYAPNSPPRSEPSTMPKAEGLTYYFGLKFPNRSGYLFSKMQLSVIFSLISLFTILFFAFSMFVILRQKKLSDLQKDFINNMTHEFKTPISTIKISADVFLNDSRIRQDERLSRYAQIIREQNQRLNDQVQKVLQLAKLERDRFALRREVVDVNGLVQQVVESASIKGADRNGHLCTQLPEAPLTVRADRFHLTNVIYNLLDNAMKYGGDPPRVCVALQCRGRRATLRVSDEGPGIPPEHQGRIFEKFYRIPTGDVHNVKGFGLGLYYVKKICEAHGWNLRLESEPGQGTALEVHMPVHA